MEETRQPARRSRYPGTFSGMAQRNIKSSIARRAR